MLVYSVALVLVMIFRPQGIFGSWEFSLPKLINRIFYPKRHNKDGNQDNADSKGQTEKTRTGVVQRTAQKEAATGVVHADASVAKPVLNASTQGEEVQ